MTHAQWHASADGPTNPAIATMSGGTAIEAAVAADPGRDPSRGLVRGVEGRIPAVVPDPAGSGLAGAAPDDGLAATIAVAARQTSMTKRRRPLRPLLLTRKRKRTKRAATKPTPSKSTRPLFTKTQLRRPQF